MKMKINDANKHVETGYTLFCDCLKFSVQSKVKQNIKDQEIKLKALTQDLIKTQPSLDDLPIDIVDYLKQLETD